MVQASGQTCGRFRQSQLKQYQLPLVSGGSLPWQRCLLSLVAILGLGRLETTPVQAQVLTEQREPLQPIAPVPAQPSASIVQTIVLKGKVTSANDGAPLSGVNIVIKGTTSGTVSDEKGEYELDLPEWNSSAVSLVYSFIGYQTVERVIRTDGPATPLAIALEADVHMLGEVSIVQVKYRFPKNILMFPAKVFYKTRCLIGL